MAREFFEVPRDRQNHCHRYKIYRHQSCNDIPTTLRYMAIHFSQSKQVRFHFQTEFSLETPLIKTIREILAFDEDSSSLPNKDFFALFVRDFLAFSQRF